MSYHGIRIKEARLAHATLRTKTALSKASGVSRNTIQKIEAGNSQGSGQSVLSLYLALGLAWQLIDALKIMDDLDRIMNSRQANKHSWDAYFALPAIYKQKIEDMVMMFFDLHLAAYGPDHDSWLGPLPD